MAKVGNLNPDYVPSAPFAARLWAQWMPTDYPRWTTIAGARPYRFVMKLMHAHGWCYPSHVLADERSVWCRWCGMRGRR